MAKLKMFESARLGPLQVKNRLVLVPVTTCLSNETGGVTQQLIDYYAERAKGGVGTIITEVTCVDYPLGVTASTNLTLHDNAYVAGHNFLTEAVHTYGTKIFCQLEHAGRQTTPSSIKGLQPVAPSAIACKFINVVPRALTTGEVEEIVQKFIDAAGRAKTAGYDGVELHGAHGYLIAQFMSESSNQRTDKYGGSFQNRMRFPQEIIRGIKKSLKDFPIIVRMSSDEFVEKGRTLEESKRVARLLAEEGVAALDVTTGCYDAMRTIIEPMSYEEGWKIHLAAEIKKVVAIPVIAVSVIRNPSFAEKILKEGRVDFVGMGRALVADPYWPQKAKEGRDQEINRCISCNVGCIGRTFQDLPFRCAVNPATGREREFSVVVPAMKKKKVLVVGGGPAGMEAARVAKLRGHQVTLVEKAGKLGGQLRLGAVPPGKDKINWFSEYLVGQMKKLKVKVQLKQDATPAYVQKIKPDVVILATGAVPCLPDIPGIQSPKVVKAWDVLEGKKKIKDATVLIAGGGTVGCETALFLSGDNRRVKIVEMLADIALDMEIINRMDTQVKIKEADIEVLLGKRLQRITEEGVIVAGEMGKEELLPADWIVLALGAKPNDSLAKKLEGKVPELYVIGDSSRPRKIIDATYEGSRLARVI